MRAILPKTYITLLLILSLVVYSGCQEQGEQTDTPVRTVEQSNLPAGITVQGDKIRFIGMQSGSISGTMVDISQYGRVIPTENPNIYAAVSTGTGRHHLTILTKDGETIAAFPVQSELIFIPKDKNFIWVVGRLNGEWEFQIDPVINAGLYQYDFQGKLMATVDKSQTRGISQIVLLQDGKLIILTNSNLMKISGTGEIVWSKPSTAHRVQVFHDGKIICTETSLRNENSDEVSIYDENGVLIKQFRDTNFSDICIIGSTSDFGYFAIEKLISIEPIKYQVNIYESSGFSVIHQFDVPGRIDNLQIAENASFFVGELITRNGIKLIKSIIVLDNQGCIIGEYKTTNSEFVRFSAAPNYRLTLVDNTIRIHSNEGDYIFEVLK